MNPLEREIKRIKIFGIFIIIIYFILCIGARDDFVRAEEGTKQDFGPLPEVQVCKPQANGKHWIVRYKYANGFPCAFLCDYCVYACKEVAKEGDAIEYTRTSDPDSDIDCKGQPIRRIAFVVGGFGGELRYNKNTGDAKEPRGTLVAFTGSGGNAFVDGGSRDGVFDVETGKRCLYVGRDPDKDNSPDDNDYRALELKGIRVVAVKWQPGVLLRKKIPWTTGWMTRYSGAPSSFPIMTKRPAAIIKYVGENLTPKQAKFGVAGTCGGSLQATSILWHDVGREVDYAGFHSGGGLLFSIDHMTGAIPTQFSVNKNTGQICDKGALCGKEYDYPPIDNLAAAYVDYVHQSSAAWDAKESLQNKKSSFLFTEFSGTIPKNVGFNVNSEPGSDIPGSDMNLGTVWTAGMMRELLYRRTGIKGAWINLPGKHGQAMESGHDAFKSFKEQVLNAFDID